jgi:hypothetical protein
MLDPPDAGCGNRYCPQGADRFPLIEASVACPVDNTIDQLPLSSIPNDLAPDVESLERLARRFKVSTLVVLRRMYDARRLSWDEYRTAYDAEFQRVMEILGRRAAGGGNFFNTQPARVSRRFARAIVTSTLEGQTLYRDAMQLLGFKKAATLHELASHLGIG